MSSENGVTLLNSKLKLLNGVFPLKLSFYANIV